VLRDLEIGAPGVVLFERDLKVSLAAGILADWHLFTA